MTYQNLSLGMCWKLVRATLNKTLFLDSENFQLSPSLSINLTKMKNKDYYWLFVKKSTPLVTALSKWEQDLSSNDIHWKNYFK